MGYADVIMVKHFFSAGDAGLYAAAALGARIILFFVGFVPTVLLPRAAHRFARGERTREVLFVALAFVVVACAIAIVAYYFFGLTLLHVLVGRAFDAAFPLLIGYAVAMGLLATTNALASYCIATHRLAFSIPLVGGTFLTLAAIALYHASLQQVIGEMIAGNGLLTLLVAIALIAQAKRKPA
jgi:O-antigen/teichoic acid export membrane protein